VTLLVLAETMVCAQNCIFLVFSRKFCKVLWDVVHKQIWRMFCFIPPFRGSPANGKGEVGVWTQRTELSGEEVVRERGKVGGVGVEESQRHVTRMCYYCYTSVMAWTQYPRISLSFGSCVVCFANFIYLHKNSESCDMVSSLHS
jgi:hypothetical protein